MNVTIVERDFASFFAAPFNAYPNNSLYVSPFRDDLKRFLSDSNPLFAKYGEFTYFTALREGRPVGRVTAHIHRQSNEKFNTQIGYFGYFDCENNLEVAQSLMTAVENWNQSKGMKVVRGNFNLTAMQQVGVTVGGFEQAPYIDQVYSPLFIAQLLTQCGYKPQFPMTTFEIQLDQVNPQSLIRDKQKDLLKDPNFSFEKIHFFNTKRVLKDVMKVLNAGFANNPMFVPLTWEEFIFQAKDMMWVMDHAISCLAKYEQKPIGTVVCIPDLNPLLKKVGSRLSLKTLVEFIRHKRTPSRAVIIFYSVSPEFHGRGVNPLMLSEVLKNLKSRGYQSLGITWIADENPASLAQMKKLGASPLHHLNIFEKELR